MCMNTNEERDSQDEGVAGRKLRRARWVEVVTRIAANCATVAWRAYEFLSE